VFCQQCSFSASTSALPITMWFLIHCEVTFLLSPDQSEGRRIA
jgi:hypothetical protein